MTCELTKKSSESMAVKFNGDCLHILKDLARIEKKHKMKILKAHARLSQALCDMDQEFKMLNARIDRTLAIK